MNPFILLENCRGFHYENEHLTCVSVSHLTGAILKPLEAEMFPNYHWCFKPVAFTLFSYKHSVIRFADAMFLAKNSRTQPKSRFC